MNTKPKKKKKKKSALAINFEYAVFLCVTAVVRLLPLHGRMPC